MEDRTQQELQRRMVILALGLRPGDLREALSASPVRVSYVLNGATHLRDEERRALRRLVSRRVDEIFGEAREEG